jgi:hypothetical protein
MKYVLLLLLLALPLRAQQEQWTVYNTTNSGLPSGQINALALQDTLLWAGTPLGLARFDGSTWQVFNTVNSPMNGNYVKSLYAASSSVLWIGTTIGATSYSGTQWTTYTSASSPLPSNDVRAITGWNGSVWFATAGGLASFNGSTWTVYTTKNSALPSDNLLSLTTGAGALWIGTDGAGLVRFTGSVWTSYTTQNSPLPTNVVMSVTAGDERSIYAGTWDNNGLAVFRTDTGQWQIFQTSGGIADGSIRALAASNCGLVWAGTRFGGLTSNRVTFRSLYATQTSAIPGNYILSLAPTEEDIWIGTDNGLAFVNRSKQVYPQPAVSYCQSQEFTLPFDVDGLTACSGIFQVQLSDATGAFTAPVSLVRAQSAYPFSLAATIPAATTPGNRYRIRILGADTSVSGISAPFTINPAPKPVLAVPAIVHLCGDDSLTLDPGAFASYRWSTGDTTRSITIRKAGTYFVTVSNQQGCSAVSSAVYIETHDRPQPIITSTGSMPLCPGDTLRLSVGIYDTYLWSNGSTAASLIVTAGGTYSVRVTDGFGCTAFSEPVEVSMYPKPQKPSITNINNTLYSSPALGYQWSRNGQTIEGATDRLYKPQQSGSYTVTTRDENFCRTTSEPYSITIVDVQQANSDSRPFIISQNEEYNSVAVSGFPASPCTVRISVIDVLGNIILSKNVEAHGTHFYEQISLAPFAAGCYFVIVQTDNTLARARILRQ